jgi:hypothetical protein
MLVRPGRADGSRRVTLSDGGSGGPARQGHRWRQWRRNPWPRALAVVLGGLLAAGVVAGVLGGGTPSGQPGSTVPGASGPPLPAAHVGPVHGPTPPATGAWLGAWVRPARYRARVLAVEAFQAQIGRPITIVHDYHPWASFFPNGLDRWAVRTGHVLLLSWAGTDTRAIVAGRYDGLIRTRAEALRRLGGRILLEWRWEMDRPDLSRQVGSPAAFIAAWRHIHRIFTQVGAGDIGWVWCPTAYGFGVGRAAAYYPGDAWVDWVCVDAYPRGYRSLADVLRPFLEWARGHPKPAMVGEFGVPAGSDGQQARWLAQLPAAARRMRSVRAYVYFDSTGSALAPGGSLRAFGRLAANPFFARNAAGVAG